MDNKKIGTHKDIVFYSTNNQDIEVLVENENIWLNVAAIASLFEIDRSGIIRHISNIYSEEELSHDSTCAKNAQVQKEGNREVTRTYDYYNLDMIISIGFRVNSKKAITFRTWANKIIKEYMVKGFALNDSRFIKANVNDKEYFKELYERIKLIRVSERMFYQKITDIFSECSVDYDKNSDIAKEFFATIQNKFHYAITGNTAAELIYDRVDNGKINMGLNTWKNSPDGKILKTDVLIAKNYLDEKELRKLNNLVNIFLDVAESNVEEHRLMRMSDWKDEVDTSLKLLKHDILETKGSISKEIADKKAFEEYEQYKTIQDKNYVSDFDIFTSIESKLDKK